MSIDKSPGTVGLSYGRGRLTVPLAGRDPLVVAPRDAPALPDPAAALRAALRDPLDCLPLREQVRDGDHVVISICDGTRAQPRDVMLPAILDEIDEAAPSARVTLLVATGTHRGNTRDELLAMVGADVLARVTVVNHDARDDSVLVDLGTAGDGVRLELNRSWVDADLRITTGFVEPHFFAGFSGGPKMVAPGLAGLRTVMTLHDATRIGDPLATWGPVKDNPVHRDIRACAAVCPPHLALDVLLDRDKAITHVYAGELFAMHDAACARAYELAMSPVPEPFDVVVTTGSGFPLDQNLYQAVKGLAAAERIIAPGGTIVLAAACEDGLPDHGSFAEVLSSGSSPAELLDIICAPGYAVPDQWQVQVLARVLSKARVLLVCDGLTDAQVRAAHLEPAHDVARAVNDALASHQNGRVAYLPEGPQTIPYVA
jgi:lactate racemase